MESVKINGDVVTIGGVELRLGRTGSDDAHLLLHHSVWLAEFTRDGIANVNKAVLTSAAEPLARAVCELVRRALFAPAVEGLVAEMLSAPDPVGHLCAEIIRHHGEPVLTFVGASLGMLDRWVRHLAEVSGIACDWYVAGGLVHVGAVTHGNRRMREALREHIEKTMPALIDATNTAIGRGNVIRALEWSLWL